MSKPTDSFDEIDLVLGRFFQELEQSRKPESVLESYCQQYPELANELHNLFRLRPIVRQEENLDTASIPKQLGDFKIIRLIGHGGMGDVYEAIQLPFHRRVVVKTIRRGKVSPAARERFLREQRVLAGLHQSHIVPVFAGGEEQEIQYFAMPFIDGATLRSIVRTASQWDTVRSNSKTPAIGELARAAAELEESSRNNRTAATVALSGAVANRGGNNQEGRGGAASVRKASRGARSELSTLYFRSVAEVTAEVADSLDHAHQRGFLHRDIKPSNIMVETNGQSWVIDFGLVRSIHTHDASEPDSEGALAAEPLTHGLVGTPGYMAPEQERHEDTDARTDVWALGATLYELLTLKPAYPPERNFAAHNRAAKLPLPPRQIVPTIPRDLEAICTKAMRLDPGSRYASCRELSSDLRRWLAGEPTIARPARTARRVKLWANRNRGWASAIVATVLALLIVATSIVAFTKAEAASATKLAATAQRATQVLEVQAAISRMHFAGWSEEAWEQIQAAALVEVDDQLRSLAASLLTGFDARRIKGFDDFSSEYVIFDPAGERLLVGGAFDKSRRPLSARIWDMDSVTLEDLSGVANGPIGFRPEGIPVQLRLDESSVVLVNLASSELLCKAELPGNCILLPLAALTPDGSRIAAAGTDAEGHATAWIWDGNSGKLLQTIAADIRAIGFSPDGSLLAGGTEDGMTRVWSVSNGSELCAVRSTNSPINCLSFSSSRTVRSEAPDAANTEGWLLATGDDDGLIALWDLTDRVPLAYCRGSQHQVYSLAFSPDGMLLASGGRGEVRLWDVATGRLLLTLRGGDYLTGLAFAPDGRTLATSTASPADPCITLWRLEFGGAGRKYLGLAGQVSHVVFSRNGRYLAALSHNWRVAVWDLQRNALVRVFVAPRGFSADNAALAFNADGRQLAFSSMRGVRLWDIESGRTIGDWRLPGALCDCLCFDARGKLLSLRVETRNGELPPLSNANPQEHPRVCRIRELAARDRATVIAEIEVFSRHVHATAAAPDASCFVIDGVGGPNGMQRMIKVFDARGRELADIPNQLPVGAAGVLCIDPTGIHLAASTDTCGQATFLKMPACKYQGKLASMAVAQSPKAHYWVRRGLNGQWDYGMWLYERGGDEPIIGLGTDVAVTSVSSSFDPSGRFFAWGSEDGAVTVCDLKELFERMGKIDPKW